MSGDDDELAFVSLYNNAARLQAEGRPFDEVIAAFNRASDAAPGRAEALHDASRLCRINNKFAEGYEYARRGLVIPRPADGLSVQQWIYDYGLLDELAVNAYWIERYQECLDACHRLLREDRMPANMRDRAKKNADFAAGALSRLMSGDDLTKSLYQLVMNFGAGGTRTSSDMSAPDMDFLAFLLRQIGSSSAQLFQDLWVLYETRSKRGGYFIEFGAADGRDLSNTFLLENTFGWQGVVAEPNPVFYGALQKNRRCFISPLCVAPLSGERVEFNQTHDPLLSTMQTYSQSDFHSAMRKNGNIISVETVSLADLLSLAGAPRTIDYLSIDTEGSEFDILSAFEFGRYDIRLITVEHNYSPRRDDILRLLTAHGYRRTMAQYTMWDDWYVRDALQRPA